MDFTYYLQELNDNFNRGSERSHYPALKQLLDGAAMGINGIIEERGNQAGIPDFTVRRSDSLIGYMEAKKIGENLTNIEKTEQLQRYFESSIGQNLILTNYLEFRWYQDGKLKLTSNLGNIKNQQIIPQKNLKETATLLEYFVNYRGKSINNYYDLAQQMAVYTKSIKFAIQEGLNLEDDTGELTKLKLLFQELLLPDLDNQNFADMYAQTIAYGLFTARIGHQEKIAAPNHSPTGEGSNIFNRKNASNYITNKIPFLQGLFTTVIETDIIAKINWSIDNLVELLAKVDMANILENFGQETRRQDPVVHFYETFLAAYEANLRKSRGVYYTPEPVVYFIVKAVNDILDQDFDLENGLASRKVNILDPATGTGTFLYQVIKQIYANFSKYGVHNWHKLLREKQVLNRLYGFELLMTPYTIAHLKLGLLLETLGYRFEDNERLNIFLTNTLEEGVKKSEFLLGKYIAEEANKAAKVKSEILIDVVLGNPPYSGHSENKNDWIDGLIRDYYQIDGVSLNEKNSKWLQDDYVKFIRFGQWKIDKTGSGILGFVTNHGYLDNPTFRGMRQNLLQSFNRIYVINLHGNAKKKEVSPDGSPDQNVFDIQQGVSILIAVKDFGPEHPLFQTKNKPEIPENGVYYHDLWGSRETKYQLLHELNINTINWEKVNPVSPFYLFIPQNTDLLSEYNQGWKITEIMPVNVLGFQTHRDDFAIDFDRDKLYQRIQEMRDQTISDQEYLTKYNLKESKTWQFKKVRQEIIADSDWEKPIIKCLYRPFDERYCYFSTLIMDRPRRELINHVAGKDNLVLNLPRIVKLEEWRHSLISNYPCTAISMDINGSYVFPLYIYPETNNEQSNLFQQKTPNFSPEFVTAITEKLGYLPTPENIFYYMYAILHSPTYRERYAEFLKMDFPRIPLTSNDNLFRKLTEIGEKLVNLHLMKNIPLTKGGNSLSDFPLFQGGIKGGSENLVTQVKYDPKKQRIYINQTSYFSNITEEVWHFKIGGYQVLDKWLKDRKKVNRTLSNEDILHYQKIVIIIQETIKLMTEIEQIIDFCRSFA